MDSIRIDTGEKRIAINDDPNRVLVFNPSDVLFAEKFYKLIGEFEVKLEEYRRQGTELEADETLTEQGVPANADARIQLMTESCHYVRGRIDYLFGEGTSEMVFGDVLNLEMFSQFFEGITPFIQGARKSKVAQYVAPKPAVKAARATKRSRGKAK